MEQPAATVPSVRKPYPSDLRESAVGVQDRDGARLVVHALRIYGPTLPFLSSVWANSGYSGPLADELRDQLGWEVEIVKCSDTQPKGTFAVQPHRWIVEHAFAWRGGLR